jgi:glycosyltransferase involved in cell wall biosynthesis
MNSAGEKNKRRKVFFVHPKRSTFIQADMDILSQHFEIRSLDVGGYKRSLKNKLVVGYRLFRGTLWADVTFSWFADEHARGAVQLSRLLGKPSIVVVGGYEVAKVPEIGYGSLLNPKKAKTVRYVLKNASSILAVSRFTQKEIGSSSDTKRVELVYNGVDTEAFKPIQPKESLVMTVGEISRTTIRLKGFRTFVESAAAIPGARFAVVGPSPDGAADELKRVAPKNVEFVGFVPNERLREMYGKAKVYCQLSMYESFGMALVEAMSSGCVPVVADSGALPEVVGDTGFVVPVGDVVSTSKAIQDALQHGNGDKARRRVKESFSIEARERELVRIIDWLSPVKQR